VVTFLQCYTPLRETIETTYFTPRYDRGLNSALRRTGRAMPISGVASCGYSVTMLCFDATDISDPAFRGVHETLMGLAISAMRPNGKEIFTLTEAVR
jgi:hypothetical protein